MGHAGAIIAGGKGTADEGACSAGSGGCETVRSPADIGEALKAIIK